jgi:lipopolysaccharide export system protein LptA
MTPIFFFRVPWLLREQIDVFPRPRGRVVEGGGIVLLLFSLLGGLVLPAPLRGQAGECDVPHFDRFTITTLSNGSRITYFSNATIRCRRGTRIQADSAVFFESTNYAQLFGNVAFSDESSRLTADEARYFETERRLRAWGNAVLTDLADGSVIRGDTMVLLGATEQRSREELTVTGRRPTATLYPAVQPVEDEDTTGAVPPDSAEVLPPDTAAGLPVDTTAAVPRDSAAGPPPDTASGPPPDRAVGPDSLRPAGVPTSDFVDSIPSPAPVPRQATPYEIDARRMFLEGQRYFRATGAVNIRRDSLRARADSVEYDESGGTLFLAREAHLETEEFQIDADTIHLDIPGDDVREVTARREAVLDGEDLLMLAPTIRLFLEEGALERLVAVRDTVVGSMAPDSVSDEGVAAGPLHPAARSVGLERFPLRPYTFAEDFLLWADSVEVLAPGEILDRVKAVGTARGETLARDTLNTPDTPDLIRRDWLEGDTVLAIFAPVPDSVRRAEREAGDTTGARYRLDRLVARSGARSLYRLAPSDSTLAEGEEGDDRLAVHYVTGAEITILMEEGEVDRMEVVGPTKGLHLEPVARRAPPPDTSAGGEAVPPDSASNLPDTAVVTPPDTTAVSAPHPPSTPGGAGLPFRRPPPLLSRPERGRGT